MTLYEMTTGAMQLYEMLASGEIDEKTFNDTLEGMGADEKLENYCKVIKQLEADETAFKAEKDRLYKKQQAAAAAITRMKNAIADFLHAKGETKSKAGVFTVALSTSKAVSIADEKKVPARFLVEQSPKIDKAAIRAELMAGGEVAGCELKINEGVRIK